MTRQIFPLNQQIPNQSMIEITRRQFKKRNPFLLSEAYLCSQEELFCDHMQETQKG
jgi:hypothetical protein